MAGDHVSGEEANLVLAEIGFVVGRRWWWWKDLEPGWKVQ